MDLSTCRPPPRPPAPQAPCLPRSTRAYSTPTRQTFCCFWRWRRWRWACWRCPGCAGGVGGVHVVIAVFACSACSHCWQHAHAAPPRCPLAPASALPLQGAPPGSPRPLIRRSTTAALCRRASWRAGSTCSPQVGLWLGAQTASSSTSSMSRPRHCAGLPNASPHPSRSHTTHPTRRGAVHLLAPSTGHAGRVPDHWGHLQLAVPAVPERPPDCDSWGGPAAAAAAARPTRQRWAAVAEGGFAHPAEPLPRPGRPAS